MTTAHEISSPTTAVLRSQNVVLFYLPIVVIGTLALSLFAGFLGDQATEVAKLIEEIEASCQSVAQQQLQPATTSEALEASQSTTCQAYFGKVVLFFVLLVLWCWATFVITLRAADSIKHVALRLTIAALVSVSLPAIVFTKYFASVPLSIYTDSGRFMDAFLTFDGRYPVLAALVAVVVVVMQIVLVALFASRPSTAVHPRFIEISFWLSIAAFVILSLVFTFAPGNPYDHVGSINLIVLYALLAYTFLAGLFHYSRKTGLPLAMGLATYVLIVNGLGLNHQFKTPQPQVPAGRPEQGTIPKLAQGTPRLR